MVVGASIATASGQTWRGESSVIKADLVDTVYQKVGLSRNEAAHIVEVIFSVMKEALRNGEDVQVVGFGNFKIRQKRTRVGRNPKTGEEIMITSRKVLTFKPSRNLRDIANGKVGRPHEAPLA